MQGYDNRKKTEGKQARKKKMQIVLVSSISHNSSQPFCALLGKSIVLLFLSAQFLRALRPVCVCVACQCYGTLLGPYFL